MVKNECTFSRNQRLYEKIFWETFLEKTIYPVTDLGGARTMKIGPIRPLASCENLRGTTLVRTNLQSNLWVSCQSHFSLCRHHPSHRQGRGRGRKLIGRNRVSLVSGRFLFFVALISLPVFFSPNFISFPGVHQKKRVKWSESCVTLFLRTFRRVRMNGSMLHAIACLFS